MLNQHLQMAMVGPMQWSSVTGRELVMRWFDEILLNEKLGHCRGTGVVQLINGEWKIAHYALTMLIPNAIAAEVGTKTKEVEKL